MKRHPLACEVVFWVNFMRSVTFKRNACRSQYSQDFIIIVLVFFSNYFKGNRQLSVESNC